MLNVLNFSTEQDIHILPIIPPVDNIIIGIVISPIVLTGFRINFGINLYIPEKNNISERKVVIIGGLTKFFHGICFCESLERR